MSRIAVLTVIQGTAKTGKPYKMVKYVQLPSTVVRTAFVPVNADIENPSEDRLAEVFEQFPQYDVEFDNRGQIANITEV